MNCVNIKHPDFLSLLEETKLTSFVLEVKIAKWQETTNSAFFPTAQELVDFKENKQDTVQIKSSLSELIPNLTEEKIKEIYDNYVELMNRVRKGKEMPFKSFKSYIKNTQVLNYKDTYIFGTYDVDNGVFISRVNSSPSSKSLLAETIPAISKSGINVISFVPRDYAEKLKRSGYTVSKVGFNYDFKGEDMVKYAATSNPLLLEKIFKKPVNKITSKDLEWYNNRLTLKYTAVDIDSKNIENINNDVNEVMSTYLKQFGVIVKDVQKEMSIDSFAFADILSKVAFIKDKSDLPLIAGEFIAFMMQQNPLVKDIIYQLYQKELGVDVSYVSFRQNYSGIDKNSYFKKVGELISEELTKKVNLKEKPDTLIQKIKDLIEAFFNLLKGSRHTEINKNIGIIANNILQQNKRLITESLYKPGAMYKQTGVVSIQQALERDQFGKKIIEDLSNVGFILTGSTALSEQGVILRPNENMLHDIDFVSPFLRKETINKFLEVFPKAIKVRDITNSEYVTDTYIVAPEGHDVKNFKIVQKGDKIFVESYDVVNKKEEVVGTFNLIFEDGKAKEVHTGIEAKTLDFFSKSKREPFDNFDYTTSENKTIPLANWKSIFKAKLEFARYKDIWDYNRFIPNTSSQTIERYNEYKTLSSELTEQEFNSLESEEQQTILEQLKNCK